jgi:serine/threonine protein phosphatase 1
MPASAPDLATRSLAARIDGPVVLIGDVHGQLDLLDRLLDRLSRRADFAGRWIVFLGDLVDRGPDPRGVLERVLELMASHPRTTSVCGNHDLAMAGSLELVPVPAEAQWARRWRRGYQCETTFRSYGVEPFDFESLARAVPEDHARLLSAMPWVVEHPGVICVHAGLTRELPTSTQLKILRERDFTLHRPAWLCRQDLGQSVAPADCRVPVASGHVARPKPYVDSTRILLDCTGGEGGELTGLLLPEYELVTSHRDAYPVRRRWWPFGRRAA